jgi:hypothetical protein
LVDLYSGETLDLQVRTSIGQCRLAVVSLLDT